MSVIQTTCFGIAILLSAVGTAQTVQQLENGNNAGNQPPKIAVMETAFGKRADATSFADAKAAGYTAMQMHSGVPAGLKKKPFDQSMSLVIGSDPAQLESWQAESKIHGVKIISLCAGSLNKCQIWDQDRELAMRIAKQTIDGCHTLGVHVMLFPFFGPSNFQTDDGALNGVAGFMKELLPYAQEKNVVIGIEAPITTVRVLKLMKKLNFPKHLKIYYDTGNLFAKEDIYETIRKYGKQHFCEVHIKAAGHAVAGQGQIDLAKLAHALNDAQYDKWLVYEANRDGKDPESNRKVMEEIVRLREKNVTEPANNQEPIEFRGDFTGPELDHPALARNKSNITLIFAHGELSVRKHRMRVK